MPTAPKTFRLHGSATSHRGKSADTIERCKKYRTKAWAQTRIRIIARDGGQCRMCGRFCIGKGEAHIDHIKAVVDGGSDEDENLRLLCSSCHNSRTRSDQNAGDAMR